jgi:hypothetical protein
MGAGVAASPHCPNRRFTKPGRRGARAGLFRNRAEPGARTLVSGVLPRPEGHFRFPRGLPVRAEALNGSPLGGSEAEASSSDRGDPKAEAPSSPGWILKAEASWSAWQAMDRNPGSCRFAAPGSENPVLPDVPLAEASFPPVAALRTEVPLSAGLTFGSEDPPDRPGLVPSAPEGASGPGWALLEACRLCIRIRASPQLPPSGGFVSRPAFPRRLLFVWWDNEARFASWPWLGRLSSVAGRSSRPRRKAVTSFESHQADFQGHCLWKTRITGISEPALETAHRQPGRGALCMVDADGGACGAPPARIKERGSGRNPAARPRVF